MLSDLAWHRASLLPRLVYGWRWLLMRLKLRRAYDSKLALDVAQWPYLLLICFYYWLFSFLLLLFFFVIWLIVRQDWLVFLLWWIVLFWALLVSILYSWSISFCPFLLSWLVDQLNLPLEQELLSKIFHLNFICGCEIFPSPIFVFPLFSPIGSWERCCYLISHEAYYLPVLQVVRYFRFLPLIIFTKQLVLRKS